MSQPTDIRTRPPFGDRDRTRRVILIDDDEDDYLLTREYFDDFERADHYTLEWVSSYEEGLEVLLDNAHDVCLLDYRLGARDGIELLQEALDRDCRTPIILLTGEGNRTVDTAAMRRGAADYLVKGDITPPLLERSLRHSLERHRFTEAQRFLADAGARLTSTLDYEETLEAVAELSAQFIADYCAIDVVDEDGERSRLTVGMSASGDEEIAAWLRENPCFDNSQCAATRALDSQQSVLIPEVDDTLIEALSTTDDRREALQRLGPTSMMAVPLVARDRLLGSILFIAAAPNRHYDHGDLGLAEQLAFRTALATENALLYGKAQRAIELRDEVHRIVVHDLRNPLSTIGLTAQHLERRIQAGADDEQLLSYLGTQRKATARMNRLIEDLLDVARIEDDQLSLQRASYCPKMLVEEVVSQHHIQAEEKELTISSDLPDELPRIHADIGRVEQVLSNLVSNALKFTLSGGHIELAARAEDDAVVFKVSDTGVGMSQEQAPRLFDRFWQAEQGARHGAGLGLAISKGIVEAHDGTIWVESEKDVGTTFRFTIPTV